MKRGRKKDGKGVVAGHLSLAAENLLRAYGWNGDGEGNGDRRGGDEEDGAALMVVAQFR